MSSLKNKLKLFTFQIKSFETAWKNKTSFKKWEFFYDFCKLLGDILQLNVLSDLKIGIVGYITGVTGVFHFVLLIYTIYYYINRDNSIECLRSFCILGLYTSAYCAYITTITKSKYEWKRLLNISGKYIYRNDRKSTDYNCICDKTIKKSIQVYIIKMFVICLSFVGAVIGPYYSFVQYGTLTTFYSLKLPYFNQNPYTEFIINVAWQLLISLICVVSLFLLEAAITLTNDTITVSSELCLLELKELSDRQVDKTELRRKMNMIYMRIAYIDEFIKSFGKIMYWRHFLATPMSTLSIAVSIYCQKMMGFPAGYGLAVVSYVQMAVMCYAGQNITERNDRLLKGLYEVKWYLLPNRDQKDVMHMIYRLQNEVSLTIGPFQELNLETLKALSQKMYSFLMFLNNFEA